MWPARYPRLRKVIFDNCTEFKKILPLLHNFAIKPTPTLVKNPQDKVIFERVHQVQGDMLHTKKLQQHTFDSVDPWCDLLTSVFWASHSTHHTILHSSPAKFFSSRDMLLNIKFIADWDAIKIRN